MLLPIILYLWLASLFSSSSSNELTLIGDKIWKNECGGKIEGLISWNSGEEFASLGIGHFIWYPAGEEIHFKETFPALIAFMKTEGISIPLYFETHKTAPWKNKAEFEQAKDTVELNALRQFLYETRGYQAKFIYQRLRGSLRLMMDGLSNEDSKRLQRQFNRLSKTSDGTFALVDYLNFKGEGILTKEQYHHVGWGLKQVLLKMQEDIPPLPAFSKAAIEVLEERVKNSPPERHEERWLPGWRNRVKKYLL